MSNLPRKAIASLGHRYGAARRRNHAYVTIPIETAAELKAFLAALSKAAYQKEYRKL